MAKLAKADVDYSKGMKSAHCGICRHFIGHAQCALVAGLIDQAYWCERFQKPKK